MRLSLFVIGFSFASLIVVDCSFSQNFPTPTCLCISVVGCPSFSGGTSKRLIHTSTLCGSCKRGIIVMDCCCVTRKFPTTHCLCVSIVGLLLAFAISKKCSRPKSFVEKRVRVPLVCVDSIAEAFARTCHIPYKVVFLI